MTRIVIIFLFLFIFSCSTQEDVTVLCKGEPSHGSVIKDGNEFFCPFTFRVKNAEKIWEIVEKPRIIAYEVSDYYPLRLQGSWDSYNVFMFVPKEHFTEEEYRVSLRAYDTNYKPYGEAKEFVFYRVSEENDFVEYRTYKDGETYKDGTGQFLFFAEREMPSYDWYQVINVGNYGTSFIFKGEIVNE